MSPIQQALSKLTQAIGKLEDSVDGLESSMAGQQRDMFTPKPASNGNGKGHGIKEALIAKKLDRAIEKAEQLLKSAQG